jgi:hypothetical protein
VPFFVNSAAGKCSVFGAGVNLLRFKRIYVDYLTVILILRSFVYFSTEMKLLYLFLFFILISACRKSVAENTVGGFVTNQSPTKTDTFYPDRSEAEGNTQYELPDTFITIEYAEFTANFSRMIVSENKDSIANMDGDTIYLSIELGETLEKQLIEFTDLKLDNLKVEQAYETSITVMDEGPHCDLLGWKHYFSDWKELKASKNLTYTALAYNETDSEKFPPTTGSEIKKYVAENCGDYWAKLLGDTVNPLKYPCGVSISHYFIRISGNERRVGKKITKLIVFESPMGC